MRYVRVEVVITNPDGGTRAVIRYWPQRADAFRPLTAAWVMHMLMSRVANGYHPFLSAHPTMRHV